MEWIVAVADSSRQLLPWLAGLTVVFAGLVRLMPCNPGMFWWRDWRAAATDLLYWFLAPLLARIGKTMVLAAGVALLFRGGAPGFTVVTEMPFWAHCLGILAIQDVVLYWIHRAFHTRRAWRFHAVHHSPTVLDWVSAARFHAVNYLLSFVVADALVLLLGFAPEALIALTPFNLIYSSMVHANLNWTFGPFRFVLASPVFHRWHHVSEGEGVNTNFAPTFPILDLVFGTFYMPAGLAPEQFGNGDSAYPEDFWGQFVEPFAPTAIATNAISERGGAGNPDVARRDQSSKEIHNTT
jgi:sterol desaturase/sphingolipid hydroxylase (fatty acid hydroxylase superfamily)